LPWQVVASSALSQTMNNEADSFSGFTFNQKGGVLQ
jgi:hypothetical protein